MNDKDDNNFLVSWHESYLYSSPLFEFRLFHHFDGRNNDIDQSQAASQSPRPSLTTCDLDLISKRSGVSEGQCTSRWSLFEARHEFPILAVIKSLDLFSTSGRPAISGVDISESWSRQ